MRWVLSVGVLTAIYLLMLTSLNPWDIGAGVLLSAVLIVSFRSYLGVTRAAGRPPVAERLLWLAPYTLRAIWEVNVGTFRVAAMVLHLRPLAQAHFIEIPVDDYTENGLALNALITTLSPGSVLIDIDWSRRVMLLHVLDDAKPEEIRATYQDLYEKYQRHVLP